MTSTTRFVPPNSNDRFDVSDEGSISIRALPAEATSLDDADTLVSASLGVTNTVGSNRRLDENLQLDSGEQEA